MYARILADWYARFKSRFMNCELAHKIGQDRAEERAVGACGGDHAQARLPRRPSAQTPLRRIGLRVDDRLAAKHQVHQ
ncbi:glyoxalase [Pseudomonas sp. TCU-HL1]|nr:glyoxalase [Pseudomonas sp. TCU-HL1]